MDYFSRNIGFEYKGEADLVTDADRASEELIVSRLHERWPEHSIVGEEGSRRTSDSSYRWYVDPLDGTTNFAHGYPVFCVSIGLESAGVPQAGVLYDPTRDELFSAERGQGATLNGKPIRVSKSQSLSEAILGTGFPSSSDTRTRTYTSITSLRCAAMGCVVPAQRRLIWQTSPRDATTASGSSI